MNAEDEILSKLLLNEKQELEQLDRMVDMALLFFQIDSKGHDVVLTDRAKKLPIKDMICAYLIGIYFGSKKLKINGIPIIESDSKSGNEIAKYLGKKFTSISGRLTELVRDGRIIKDSNGNYSVTYHKIRTIIIELNNDTAGAISDSKNK